MPNRNTPSSATRYRGWFHDQLNNVLEAYYNSTAFLRATAAGAVTFLGSVLSSSASGGIGYATGAGAAVTQITSRATGVTINAICGTIQTDTSSLAAEASAVFVVTNSAVAIGDVVILSQRSGAVALNTQLEISAVAAGSFSISVINNNVAAGTAETGAIIINFAVVKAVSA